MRYAAAVFALVLAVAWVVADASVPSHAITAHTHGPVANPHAHWESDCAVCHRPHAASELTPGSVFRARDRWHDLTCEKCHAGPAHAANVADSGKEFHARCSNCHHDHGGRLNSLVRIPDDYCTRCHSQTVPEHVAGSPKREPKITSFTRDHPEFRALATPPERTLKFSHALHMTPGQASAERGREAMTLARIRELSGEAAVARYRRPGQGEGDGDLVSLDCASCHRLDAGAGAPDFDATRAALAKAGEPGRAVLPTRAAGASFLPVNFEVHCRACHPLLAPAGASAGLVIPAFEVPHRRQPKELASELNAGYVRGLVSEGHPALAAPVGPGDRPDPPPARTIREEADRLTRVASGLLLAPTTHLPQHKTEGCAKCHDFAGDAIARLPDRTVWLPAAQFNHARHRATTCATCHPGTSAAFAPAGTALVEKEPLQILGIDSCRACHSPSGSKVVFPDGTALTGGGARHGCVDCHRYHNADHGLQGRGAAALWPERPLDLTEFLRGGK